MGLLKNPRIFINCLELLSIKKVLSLNAFNGGKRALFSLSLQRVQQNCQSSSLPVWRMPAANQFPPITLRMRSTGLVQSAGGIGCSTSSILKSPLGASGTPVMLFVLRNVNGGAASQINVANTCCPVALPILPPPANTNPFPSTSMSPLV